MEGCIHKASCCNPIGEMGVIGLVALGLRAEANERVAGLFGRDGGGGGAIEDGGNDGGGGSGDETCAVEPSSNAVKSASVAVL